MGESLELFFALCAATTTSPDADEDYKGDDAEETDGAAYGCSECGGVLLVGRIGAGGRALAHMRASVGGRTWFAN